MYIFGLFREHFQRIFLTGPPKTCLGIHWTNGFLSSARVTQLRNNRFMRIIFIPSFVYRKSFDELCDPSQIILPAFSEISCIHVA